MKFRIKEIREKKGISRLRLSMLAQVPYTVLFWMEKGEPPHFDSWLERIAKALGVKKEDLIARKEE